MKFFRATAPGLAALAVLLCAVPAFASAAPDSADAYALEAGEVLTDDSDSPAPAGDNPVLDDTPPDSDGDGPADDVTTPSGPYTVSCSGADVTVNLDGRSYASVIDVGGAEVAAGEAIPGEAPADSGTLPGFLRAMFGEYTPKTQTVTTYFDGQPLDVSTEYVPGIAGVDVEWIASVVLFGVVVYCLFRLLGGMVR